MEIISLSQGANRAVSLPELLASRDARQIRQQRWLIQHQCSLLVLTPVVPGAIKDSALTRQIFSLGWQALSQLCARQMWTPVAREILTLPTGCEGFIALRVDAQLLKQHAMQLEVQHPAGRLWDIDVLDPQGQILSRRSTGLAPRRCLLCERPASVCARAGTHGSVQLLAQMERILSHALPAR